MRKVFTVAFTHWKWEAYKPFYDWHKSRVENLKVIWDVSDLKPEEIDVPDDKNVLPMKLEKLWSNMTNLYFPMCLNWFQEGAPDYFVLMESDVVIGADDFVEKSIDFMEKGNIEALFPWLKSAATHPDHPFAQKLTVIQPKYWTIPGLTIMSKKALAIYGQTIQHSPMYWNEIRLPSELSRFSVIISPSPYTNDQCICCGSGTKEERKVWSVPKEVIDKEVANGMKAFHPIKSVEMLNYVKEKFGEKESIKKEISK